MAADRPVEDGTSGIGGGLGAAPTLPEAPVGGDRPRGADRPEPPPAGGAVEVREGFVGLGGRLAGRYQLEREIGRGGMGIVYRAFDQTMGRHVALKVIAGALARDPDLTARFITEAHVTAQLPHPAIVPVHDIGRTPDGELFYTMRLVGGRTLADLGRPRAGDDPWTRFRALQAFVQVCRAAACAHERGVVHRDLKPANVMVGRFGEVYVLDWGLAKVVGARDPSHPLAGGDEAVGPRPRTHVGAVLGTPGFMSPEQAAGEGAIGPPSDVYALGAILYFLLTGEPPLTGSTDEVVAALAARISPRPASDRLRRAA